MGSNFYFKPSDEVFAAHEGWLPKAGVAKSLGGYDKYVTGEGRNVDLATWLGTALQEGTFGNSNSLDINPMWSHPYKDSKYINSQAKKYNVIISIPRVAQPKEFHGLTESEYVNQDRVQSAMRDRGMNIHLDYAAHKLDEGKKKFGSNEMASRWYNVNDPVPREKLPRLGRDILGNTTVQQIINNIRDFYTGKQYRDKLRAADQPLEGGLF